jgi:hypothetical protein
MKGNFDKAFGAIMFEAQSYTAEGNKPDYVRQSGF